MLMQDSQLRSQRRDQIIKDQYIVTYLSQDRSVKTNLRIRMISPAQPQVLNQQDLDSALAAAFHQVLQAQHC